MFTLFLAYLVTGWLGLKIGAVNDFATSVWAPSGIALAFLLRWGFNLWPAILSAAFFVNLLAGATLPAAMAIGIGNTLETCLAFHLLNRGLQRPLSLNYLSDVAKLIVLGALLSTLVSASFGNFSLWLNTTSDRENLKFMFLTWWLGDMTGILVITPLILSWSSPMARLKEIFASNWQRTTEAIVLFGSFILLSRLIFIGDSDVSKVLKLHHLFPLMIWAAVRFGQAGGTVIVMTISIIAIWGTVHNHGPFSLGHPEDNLFNLQGFMAVVAASICVLAAIITEKQGFEKNLRENALALERSNAELQRFASLASHDLKEPLRTISIRLELLQNDLRQKLDRETEEHMSFAISAAKRMQALINALLTYAKAGEVDPQLSRIDMNVEVQRILAMMQAKIDTDHVQIITDPLPVIKADPLLLAQVFQNIISNAIKFRNTAPPRIHIGCVENDFEWTFFIQDNGIGFPMTYAESIFEIFKRLQSNESVEGSGIGLALCKKIIDRHGGSIWPRSEVGRGTTFYFTIPKEV